MDSDQISQRLGLPNVAWATLDPRTVEKALDSLGIYIVRVSGAQKVGRFRGESDIIYIGSGNLGERLKAHLAQRVDFKDKGWLITLMGRYRNLEVAVFPRQYSKEKVEEEEYTLLFEYFRTHLELPPANLRLTLSKVQKAILTVQNLYPDKPPSQEELQNLLKPGMSPVGKKSQG